MTASSYKSLMAIRFIACDSISRFQIVIEREKEKEKKKVNTICSQNGRMTLFS